jgi:2,5-furandicarboxylate decarboxylase 1
VVSSLKEYLDLVKAKNWVLTIKEKVYREDIPALIEKLSWEGKILLFENVNGYSCRLVANLVPSHDVFKDLFDTENPYEFFMRGVQKKEKTIPVSEKKLKKFAVKGKNLIDLIPILKHYEKDSAPFITTGIVSSSDPDSGIVGRGIHRMEYRGKNLLGVALLNPPLTTIYEKYKSRGQRMPVAMTIGVDPALFISMALKVPPGTDKLEVAGGLRGKGIEVMPTPQAGIEVPAAGEFLLEGYIDETRGKKDGPLGEISGYYLSLKETPTIIVEHLYHKDSPIYHALLPTSPESDRYLTFVSRAHLEESAKRLFSFIVNITFVPKTFGSSLVVNVKTSEKFKIRNLILFLLSFPMIKKVVIVDDDVNADDPYDVEWAVITRCKADEDFIIINKLQGQPIDPTVEDMYGVTKIGINATIQGKSIEERARVVSGNPKRIEAIMRKIDGGVFNA